MDGWLDGWTGGRTDVQLTDKWMMDGQMMNGRTTNGRMMDEFIVAGQMDTRTHGQMDVLTI